MSPTDTHQAYTDILDSYSNSAYVYTKTSFDFDEPISIICDENKFTTNNNYNYTSSSISNISNASNTCTTILKNNIEYLSTLELYVFIFGMIQIGIDFIMCCADCGALIHH